MEATSSTPRQRSSPFQGMGKFRRLFAFVQPYRTRLYLAFGVIILGSILGLAGPYTLQFLIDAVFKKNDAHLLDLITSSWSASFCCKV